MEQTNFFEDIKMEQLLVNNKPIYLIKGDFENTLPLTIRGQTPDFTDTLGLKLQNKYELPFVFNPTNFKTYKRILETGFEKKDSFHFWGNFHLKKASEDMKLKTKENKRNLDEVLTFALYNPYQLVGNKDFTFFEFRTKPEKAYEGMIFFIPEHMTRTYSRIRNNIFQKY